MKKIDVEIAARRAYRKKSSDIHCLRLAVIHARTPEQKEEELERLARAEQQVIGISLLVDEIQRKTGYTLKTY